MARVRNELGICGKLGDLFFYRRDGKDYVKRIGKRKTVKCSEEQWRHRMRFRTAAKFASRLPEEVRHVLDVAAASRRGWSGQTFFMKQNLKAFHPDGTLKDPEALQFSDGLRGWAYMLRVETHEGNGQLTLCWSDELDVDEAERQDRLVVFVIRERLSFQVEVVNVTATREDGQVELPLEKEEGSLTHLFFFCLAPDGKSVSPTQHGAI